MTTRIASDGCPAQEDRHPARPVPVVASVPANHVYVRHLTAEEGGGPVRLADPDPDGGTRSASQRWWPPVMLEPSWVKEHGRSVDLFHVHFGFDARSEAELEAWVSAVRDTGRPIVYTVHDLRNPHHPTRDLHDRQLDVLVPAADRIITLTNGAADEIRARWGRESVVLPHPHVVPFETMRAAQAMRAVRSQRGATHPFTVGLHLKSLRPSMAPHRVLPVLVDAVNELAEGVLRVDVHCDVMTPGDRQHDATLARLLRREADRGRVDLHVHDYFSDAELWDYLAGLDVSVLPYRFGTHSGWLEACRDLGTTVVAPTCGYFSDQGPVLQYVQDEDHFDPASLVDAVRHAYAVRPQMGVSVEERRTQRRAVAGAHDLVYGALVGH